jgi:PAS domain S-box-containing protein
LTACLPDRATLFERAPCGLLVTTADGAILEINHTLCVWLGYAAQDLIGKRVDELLPVGARLFRQTHLVPLLQLQGSVAEVQLELKHSDGTALPVLAAISRVRDANAPRHDEYAFMLARDRRKYEQELLKARRHAEQALDERQAAIAALESTEAELRSANARLQREHQRKDQFMAVLGHELRNPLTPLRSGLDLLRARGAHLDGLTIRTLDIFERQVNSMNRLVDDLLDTARIGQGKLALRKEPIKLSEVIAQALEIAVPKCEQAHQRLVRKVGRDCIVVADLFRMTQVVGNLLTNASKYTPEGGTIELSYDSADGKACITVRDNGIGIREDRIESLFEMFAQEEDALGRAEGGLGIGLALVKGLIELHGGTVRASSDGPGLGSEFMVCLPEHGAAQIS